MASLHSDQMNSPSSLYRPIAHWVLIAAVTALTGWLVAALHPDGGASVAVAILLVTLTTIGPVILLGLSITSPGGLFGIVMFVAFGFWSLTWLSIPAVSWGLHQSDVVHALYLVSGGMAAYWLGYALIGPPKALPIIRPTRLIPVGLLWGLFAVGVAADLVLLRSGTLGYFFSAGTAGQTTLSWVQWVRVIAGLTQVIAIVTAIHTFGADSRPHRN